MKTDFIFFFGGGGGGGGGLFAVFARRLACFAGANSRKKVARRVIYKFNQFYVHEYGYTRIATMHLRHLYVILGNYREFRVWSVVFELWNNLQIPLERLRGVVNLAPFYTGLWAGTGSSRFEAVQISQWPDDFPAQYSRSRKPLYTTIKRAEHTARREFHQSVHSDMLTLMYHSFFRGNICMDTEPQYIDPELTILLIMAADNLLKWDKQEISLDAY